MKKFVRFIEDIRPSELDEETTSKKFLQTTRNWEIISSDKTTQSKAAVALAPHQPKRRISHDAATVRQEYVEYKWRTTLSSGNNNKCKKALQSTNRKKKNRNLGPPRQNCLDQQQQSPLISSGDTSPAQPFRKKSEDSNPFEDDVSPPSLPVRKKSEASDACERQNQRRVGGCRTLKNDQCYKIPVDEVQTRDNESMTDRSPRLVVTNWYRVKDEERRKPLAAIKSNSDSSSNSSTKRKRPQGMSKTSGPCRFTSL